MAEERDEEETVRLPGGFVVRRHFYGGVTAHKDGYPPVDIAMDLDVDEAGRSVPRMILITPRMSEPGDLTSTMPLDDATLAAVDLVEAKDQIMLIEAQTHTPGRGYTWGDVATAANAGDVRQALELIDRDAPAALTAVKRARRNKITPQLLERVLELYEQGGIDAVVEGTNYSEPYSWKLLRRARAEVGS
jgi:hypothetical protein